MFWQNFICHLSLFPHYNSFIQCALSSSFLKKRTIFPYYDTLTYSANEENTEVVQRKAQSIGGK
jgi:hypothetical protein